MNRRSDAEVEPAPCPVCPSTPEGSSVSKDDARDANIPAKEVVGDASISPVTCADVSTGNALNGAEGAFGAQDVRALRLARGYSWPPFAEGNDFSLRHGAFSSRLVDPRAAEIVEVLMETGPAYLSDPSYEAAVCALARTEARLELLDGWIRTKGGLLNAKGDAYPAVQWLEKFERQALAQRASLGLDPVSRVRLQRELAGTVRDTNIAASLEQGRTLRRRAEEGQS